MSLILLISTLMLIGIFSINTEKTVSISHNKKSLFTILILSFLVRVVFAVIFDGYETDMNCFSAWSDMIYSEGINNFYSNGQFTDYPPGYMYILYVIGFIKNFFSLNQHASYLLLKMPAIICDILSGYMLYKLSEKHHGNSVLLTSLYLFNPFIILDSAIWGQVDSVFTLPVFAMFYLVSEKKLILSYFMFALAIFIKPQALFYAPILLCGIIKQVFIEDFPYKKFFKNLIYGLLAIAFVFVLALPFGIENVILQYIQTISSYNYASVNAYNLWSAIGLNWSQLTPFYTYIGYAFIIIITALCMLEFFKRESKDKYFYFGALICYSVFILSVKMHERYAFPVVLLLLGAYAISKKKNLLNIYAIVSALLFINTAHVLFFYKPETYYSTNFHKYGVVFGILSLISLFLWWAITFKKESNSEIKPLKLQIPVKRNYKITKKDVITMLIITSIYSAVALYNLGDTKAPQSYITLNDEEEITIDLGEEKDIFELKFYNGFYELSENRQVSFSLANESNEEIFSTNISSGGVFTWNSIDVNNNARYINIKATKTTALFELCIVNSSGISIRPVSAPVELFDESDCVPKEKTFKNSTYFDEIYHARTAYEYINGLPVYEWTHPPLGKIFIATGIKLFGMTPFGWRIAGTLFGILMLPAIYIFIKKMFGVYALSLCGCILLSADFMHFAQSRIATIDVYVTFFIMMMYLFMFKYYNDKLFIKNRKKGHLILLICGVMFGLSVASKWTGLYAGAGIALIFTLAIIEAYKIDNSSFIKRLLSTGILCVIFFILIPVLIYALSYIPYLIANKEGLSGIIENQEAMLTYHGVTVVDSTHPFSSYWYEWILNLRPIWYYSLKDSGYASSISSFGNPLIWWCGAASFVYCMYKAINSGDKKATVLTISYLSGIIPWTFVERTTFIYHYFPCVPFLVLMICYSVDSFAKFNKKAIRYFAVFTVLSVVLFILFYPAISGYLVPEAYLTFLKWLPRWQII